MNSSQLENVTASGSMPFNPTLADAERNSVTKKTLGCIRFHASPASRWELSPFERTKQVRNKAFREQRMAAYWQRIDFGAASFFKKLFPPPLGRFGPIIVSISVCCYIVCAQLPNIWPLGPDSVSATVSPGSTTSQVKSVNGRAKLFINGQEYNKGITQIDYFPERRAAGVVPAYGTAGWVANMKRVMDQAKSVGTGVLIANIWWSDIDRADVRTSNPEKYYDFSALDKVMDYAKQNGQYVMPDLMLHWYAPEWWLKENNFPPNYNQKKNCDFCETDSYGNIYNNPSMGSDITERDFGTFIAAVINRYKEHPALAGWVTAIGVTGEDNYGPNYILIEGGPGGIGTIERKPLMFADYSPFFQRAFREWLKNKYQTDSALQRAWKDTKTKLTNVAVPPASELVMNPAMWLGLFPEESSDPSFSSGVENLTAKGKDFYDFRTYMTNKSREHYASLFKKNDPNHVLIFNAAISQSTLTNTNIDGIIRNDNLCFDCPPVLYREHQYWKMTSSAEKYAKNGKLIIFASENGAAQQTRKDSDRQLDYITAVEKSVKCAGGIFGYISDLSDGSVDIYPSWSSAKAQKAVREINNYNPSGNCSCDLVNNLYEKLCSSARPAGCSLIDKAKKEFCGSGSQNTEVNKK